MNKLTCTECKSVREREENFLDISVNLKYSTPSTSRSDPLLASGNASVLAAVEARERNLEEALWAMYRIPEVLEGSNMYHCEKCNKKVGLSTL